MRKLIKFLVILALIPIVGALSIVALVFVLGAFGVVLGIGGAIIGLLLTVLKFALMLALPLLLLWWIASRVLSRERTW